MPNSPEWPVAIVPGRVGRESSVGQGWLVSVWHRTTRETAPRAVQAAGLQSQPSYPPLVVESLLNHYYVIYHNSSVESLMPYTCDEHLLWSRNRALGWGHEDKKRHASVLGAYCLQKKTSKWTIPEWRSSSDSCTEGAGHRAGDASQRKLSLSGGQILCTNYYIRAPWGEGSEMVLLS